MDSGEAGTDRAPHNDLVARMSAPFALEHNLLNLHYGFHDTAKTTAHPPTRRRKTPTRHNAHNRPNFAGSSAPIQCVLCVRVSVAALLAGSLRACFPVMFAVAVFQLCRHCVGDASKRLEKIAAALSEKLNWRCTVHTRTPGAPFSRSAPSRKGTRAIQE